MAKIPMKLGTLKLKGRMGISLAPLKLSDTQELFELTNASRQHLRVWLPWVDATKSPRDSRNFIRSALKQHAANSGTHLGIRRQGTLVGVIGFLYIDWINRKAEIGYWLGDEYLGRGIMTRCCRAVVDLAFTKLKLNRVEMRVAAGNAKSRAIPERLGLHNEGVLREAQRLDGRFTDMIIYSMLNCGWIKARYFARTGHGA
jgi:ribosomal-protein-serine acetyltransferase